MSYTPVFSRRSNSVPLRFTSVMDLMLAVILPPESLAICSDQNGKLELLPVVDEVPRADHVELLVLDLRLSRRACEERTAERSNDDLAKHALTSLFCSVTIADIAETGKPKMRPGAARPQMVAPPHTRESIKASATPGCLGGRASGAGIGKGYSPSRQDQPGKRGAHGTGRCKALAHALRPLQIRAHRWQKLLDVNWRRMRRTMSKSGIQTSR